MIRPNLAWRSVAVLSAAVLALSACGDDADSPSTSATTGGAAPGDGVLKIGTILPQTGSLAFLGPPEFVGVDVAIKEINANGGVLGKPVTIQHMDSGDTSTDIATQSVNKLLTDKTDVIIGAASSSVSLSVIDKITGAGVVQISPANTSTALTTYNDKGLYFRTAPPDTLQGRVLGDLIVQDGNATTGMLVLNDSYGTGLAENAKAEIESGGGKVGRRCRPIHGSGVADGNSLQPAALDLRLSVVGEPGAVGVLEREDADGGVAVLGDQVTEHAALQDVRRRGAEVQALVGVGRELLRRVGRRELHDAGAGDLVDHRQRHARRGGADDGVDVLSEQLGRPSGRRCRWWCRPSPCAGS